MKLRAEINIAPNLPVPHRLVKFHQVGVNSLSSYNSIGFETLHSACQDRTTTNELIETAPASLRTINRDGVQAPIGKIRLTFHLGRKSQPADVYVIVGSAELQIGVRTAEDLGIVIWPVSSDSGDSEAENFHRAYPTLEQLRHEPRGQRND